MKYNDEDVKKIYKDYVENINKPDISSKQIWDNYEKKSNKKEFLHKEYGYVSVFEKIAIVVLAFVIIGGISLSYFLDKKNKIDKNETNIIEQSVNIEYKELEDYYEVSKQYQSEGCLQQNSKVWKWDGANLLIYKDGEVLWTIPSEKKEYLITREEYSEDKTIIFYYAEYEGEIYVRQPQMYMSEEDILVTTDGKEIYLLFGEPDSITHEGFTCQKPYILNMETGEYTEILSDLEIEGINYTEYGVYRDWEFYGDYAYVYIREENDHEHTIPDKKYKVNLKTKTSKLCESTVSDNYTREFDVVRRNEKYYLINNITDEQLIRLEPEIAEKINGLYINEDKSKILIYVNDYKSNVARLALIDMSNYKIEYFKSMLNRGDWILLEGNLCYNSAYQYNVYKKIKNKSEELPEYVYTGENEIIKVISEYLIDANDSFEVEEGNVFVPNIFITHEKEDGDVRKIYTIVALYDYTKEEDTLVEDSGKELVMCFYLKKENEEYVVDKVIKSKEGSEVLQSVKDMCGNNPKMVIEIMDEYQNIMKKRGIDKTRENDLERYVDVNDLDIRYVEAYDGVHIYIGTSDFDIQIYHDWIDKLSVYDTNEENFSKDKFLIKEIFDEKLEYREIPDYEIKDYESSAEDTIIINGYSDEDIIVSIIVCKDNIIGIRNHEFDEGIKWYETNKSRDYDEFKKRIMSENANGYYTWYYDITHDGLKDKILVNTRTLYEMPKEGENTISIYSGRSYELIWTENINSSHMGEGSIRIYNDGKKDYLLMWKPYMAQGDALYRCKVVKLSEDGNEEIIDEKVFSYSLNSLSVDTEALRKYGEEVNVYLEKSFVLAESGSIMGEGHSTDMEKRITTYDVEADIKSIEENLDSMQ